MFELLLKYSPWAYQAGSYTFSSGWPIWLLFALIAVSIALISFTLWRRRLLSWPRMLALGLLQSAFFSLVLVLLWRPVLLVERVRDNKNVVGVVLDTSASMAYAEGDQSRLQQAVRTLQSGPLDALGKIFTVRLFGFSERTQPLTDLAAVPPPGPQSRIGDALHDVLQTASSVPLAGVVVLTDGAENAGSLSEERLAEIASVGVPIHTVGVGPEQMDNDIELDDIAMPDSASAGEVVTAQISIRHTSAAATHLRVYDGGQLLAAREVQLPSDVGVTTVTMDVPAGYAGVHDLRFTLDAIKDERNVANNSRSQVLEVPATRRSVLYIEGEPRWEYKFIRRAMESDASIRLVSVVRATPNRFYRQGVQSAQELSGGFPSTEAELFTYDAVIIGSIEAAAFNAEQHQWLKEYVDKRGGTVMFLAGRDGLADGGWGSVPISQALPTHLTGANAHSYTLANSKVELTVYGKESALGRLDADATRNATAWRDLPALADFQSLGSLKPGAMVLLNAVSASGSVPLLVSQHYGRGAVFLFGTATTWRWKMRLPHDDQRHQTFWRQLMHALAVGAPAQIALSTERKVYDDERRVTLTAELRNDRFEPVDDVQVSVNVISEQGPVQEAPLHSGGDGRYTAMIDIESPGLYRLELKASKAGKPLGSAMTHIRRNDDVVEHFQPYQHRALLERIAQATGGRYWSLNQLADLPEAIRYSKAGVLERQTLDLWNLPAAFLLLLLLKTGEWLLRRKWRTL